MAAAVPAHLHGSQEKASLLACQLPSGQELGCSLDEGVVRHPKSASNTELE